MAMDATILAPLSLSIFSDIATSFGVALGGDAALGGYILGAILVLTLIFALTVSLGRDNPVVLAVLAAAIGTLLAIMVGWWPIYALIFIVLVLAVMLVRLPLGSGGGAGGK